MRSVYQPITSDLPRALTPADPDPWPTGGECAHAKVPRPRSSVIDAENPVAALLTPLLERASREDSRLSYSPVGSFHHGNCLYHLPRFVFRGPPGGGYPIRLGLFAAMHGDEPEGALALRELLLRLDADPAPAQGYELYVYPVCNPSGLEDHTRHSRAGYDLNREFWRGSKQPEVYFLERELGVLQFAGLVSLHSDEATDGVFAFVRGATLTDALARPALSAAAQYIPLANDGLAGGFPSRGGLVSACDDDVLSHPAEMHPLPFEIVFKTPQTFPASWQVAAATAALRAILREYRQFLAYGQNL